MKVHNNVLRTSSYGDSSNGALSYKNDRIIIIGENDTCDPSDEEFSKHYPDRPVYRLGRVEFQGRVTVHLRLVREWERKFRDMRFPGKQVCGPMFGGNYATIYGTALTRAVEEMTGHPFFGALPIHDRYETAEDYATLSL